MKEGKAYIGDDIVEGNEVIALFMGAEWCEDDYGEWGYKGNFPGPFQYRAKDNLKYNSSFDWLAPVMNKICVLGYTVQWTITDGATCRIWKYLENVPSCGVIVTDRPWTSIVQFITWYNQNKQS